MLAQKKKIHIISRKLVEAAMILNYLCWCELRILTTARTLRFPLSPIRRTPQYYFETGHD
jgi:hypothetical protein